MVKDHVVIVFTTMIAIKVRRSGAHAPAANDTAYEEGRFDAAFGFMNRAFAFEGIEREHYEEGWRSL